jgi:large subunit ribosomal protein L29
MLKSGALREMTDKELQEKLRQLVEETFRYRYQLSTGQMEDTNVITRNRRDVARLRTILRERELSQEAGK